MTTLLKLITVSALLAIGLAACSTPATPATTATPTAGQSSPSPAAKDPYDVYQANNPNKDLVLSREDAQTRAYLGCGQTFAQGTVDSVLADAYRPMGICPK